MKNKKLVHQFGKYGIMGFAANGVSYAVFLILIYTGLNPIIASGLCYVLGVGISYVGNRYWAFKSPNSHANDLPRYLIAYLAGLVFALLSMAVLIRWMHPALAQILTIVTASIVIFSCLKIAGFGRAGAGGIPVGRLDAQETSSALTRTFSHGDPDEPRD